MKVQITLDDALMERVDNFADSNYMSRSGLLSIAVTQYLNQNEAFAAIKQMSFAIQKIAETGKCDHETMEQLEDFERFSKMLFQAQK